MFTLLFTLNRRILSLNWIPSHSLELLRMEVTWLICVWDFIVCYLAILFVDFLFLFYSYLMVSHFEEQGLERLASAFFCGDFPSSIPICNLKTLFSLLSLPCSFFKYP